MALARRLDAIDESLSPTQCVVRWLDEAHGYGSLQAYVEATLDQPPDTWPATRLCREAERSARRAAGSRIPDEVNRAVRRAQREALFRFELVNRINVTTHELLEREDLRLAAVSALLAYVAACPTADAEQREMLTSMMQLLSARLAHLQAVAQARRLAEKRYLDSHAALFPDARDAWDAHTSQAEEVAVMAATLAEMYGIDSSPAQDEDEIEDHAIELLADLIEPAKVIALEKLGEGSRAARVATAWFRMSVDRASDEPSDAPAL